MINCVYNTKKFVSFPPCCMMIGGKMIDCKRNKMENPYSGLATMIDPQTVDTYVKFPQNWPPDQVCPNWSLDGI